MKLYGHFMPPPANQVRLTASAIGADFDYAHVDLTKGEHKSPDYLAVNPYGMVPALVDGDLKLAESCAISRYLASKAKSDLYPEDLKARAQIDQWMDFAAHHIRTNTGKLLFNKIFAPMMGAPVDEKAISDGLAGLDRNLPVVESQLGRTRYVAHGRLSLADTAMLAAMEPFEMVGYDVSRFANIKRWRDGLMAEPFYTRVHARYGAEMNA